MKLSAKQLVRSILPGFGKDVRQSTDKTAHDTCMILSWLRQGMSGALARSKPSQCLTLLETATPPEGVKLVGALFGKIEPISPEAETILKNNHWMVRLAAYGVGMAGAQKAERAGKDPILLVRQLAPDLDLSGLALGLELLRGASAPVADPGQLLRAAGAGATDVGRTGELLRPASGVPEADPSVLLRAASKEEA